MSLLRASYRPKCTDVWAVGVSLLSPLKDLAVKDAQNYFWNYFIQLLENQSIARKFMVVEKR